MSSDTLPNLRLHLIRELAGLDLNLKNMAHYRKIAAMIKGRLSWSKKPVSRTDLLRLAVNLPAEFSEFDRAAASMVLRQTKLPFCERHVCAGQIVRLVHHPHGHIAALVRSEGQLNIIETVLGQDKVTTVVSEVSQHCHLAYPFATPELALVYNRGEQWFARCGEFEASLPFDPHRLMSGFGGLNYFWSWYADKPLLGIGFARDYRHFIWSKGEDEVQVLTMKHQRLHGFWEGEPMFAPLGNSCVVIDGECWEFDRSYSRITRGSEAIELFPERSRECSSSLVSSNRGGFVVLRRLAVNRILELAELPYGQGWQLDFSGMLIKGSPAHIFVAENGQRLLLVTDECIVVFDRNGQPGWSIDKSKCIRGAFNDRRALAWQVSATDSRLIIEAGGHVYCLSLHDLSPTEPKALPIYREIPGEHLCASGGELHTLANYGGQIYHFKWPL